MARTTSAADQVRTAEERAILGVAAEIGVAPGQVRAVAEEAAVAGARLNALKYG